MLGSSTAWSGIGALFSLAAFIGTTVVAWIIYQSGIRERQRQQLLPLWEKLQALSRIDRAAPHLDDARNSCNIVELVAACVKERTVDEASIRKLCGPMFIATVDDLTLMNVPAGMSGKYQLGGDVIEVRNRWSNFIAKGP